MNSGTDKFQIESFFICGMARGGTTSIAAGLEAAGIQMGNGDLSGVKEDIDFRKALEKCNAESNQPLKNYLNERQLYNKNSANSILFGYKYPSGFIHLNSVKGRIYKDTLTVVFER